MSVRRRGEALRYLVIGAAGHGQEVAWAAREQARARGEACELSFFDDAVACGPVPSGLGDVVGTLDDVVQAARAPDARLVLGIGRPRIKTAVVGRLRLPDERWASVVHPAAIVGPRVSLGPGSYVAAGAVLTVNVRVGRFVTVNTHCLAAHGAALDDFVTLHPDAHLSGEVEVGEGCEVGAGALATQGVKLGEWGVIGAGCVAVRSLTGHRTWVGVPAHELVARSPASEHRRAVGESR